MCAVWSGEIVERPSHQSYSNRRHLCLRLIEPLPGQTVDRIDFAVEYEDAVWCGVPDPSIDMPMEFLLGTLTVCQFRNSANAERKLLYDW